MSCTDGIPDLLDSVTKKPIKIYRGDTITLTFTIRDTDGQASDISAKTASDYKLSSNTALDGSAPDWTVNGTFATDGTDGKISFALTAAELATVAATNYLELVDTTGSVDATLAQWKYAVLQDVKV